MKTNLSAILLLTLLLMASCGKEEFGTSSKASTSQLSGVQQFEQSSCSSFTLVKPKVDILYVVDNSTSTYYIDSYVKTAIANTVNSISSEFDYRMVGTTLLPLDATPFNDYQVMTNSTDELSDEAASRKIITSSSLDFFATKVSGAEAGLKRVGDFINNHKSDKLFRNGAYLLVILISNGRDSEVEKVASWGGGETTQDATLFKARKDAFDLIKTDLSSQDFRFFTVTAKSSCQSGWLTANKSYVAMSKIYGTSDSFDMCDSAGYTGLFTSVNSSIKQVMLHHSYRYWPITFAKDTDTRNSFGEIKVYKLSGSSSTLLTSSQWEYYENTSASPLNIRELPTVGEPTTGKHFVRFTDGNLITHPDCVQIKSVTRTEYFQYILMPREPDTTKAIAVRVNGNIIPTAAYVYSGYQINLNMKAPYPNAGDELPAVPKTGFFIKITDPTYYPKSGDTVDMGFTPAAL